MENDSYERGIEKLREMFGDAPATMLAEIETDFNRDIFRQVIGTCFGEAWIGDALTPRERSLITVAIVGALGRSAETRIHVRWALANGCTAEELREVCKHITAYAGAPAGVDAATAAGEVLEDVAGAVRS